MAFDLQTSMMVLQSGEHQVVCVNLKNIKYINAEEAPSTQYEFDFKSIKLFWILNGKNKRHLGLSVPKLRERLDNAVDNKTRVAQDTAGNSPIGQKLIMCLNRTLKCKWSGPKIGMYKN